MKNLSIFEPQIEKHYAYKKHVFDLASSKENHIYLFDQATQLIEGTKRVLHLSMYHEKNLEINITQLFSTNQAHIKLAR